MDLWDSYVARSAIGFGSAELTLSTGQRQHASLRQIEERSVSLEPSKARFLTYSEGARYIIAKDITFDLLLSVYDVNTRSAFVGRVTTDISPKTLMKIRSRMLKGRPTLELRAIGLQNGYGNGVTDVEELYKRLKPVLMEIDLFGTDTRHIAFDLKTGVPYNLLLLNRIYRPGELACQVKKEDFDGKISDLAFV